MSGIIVAGSILAGVLGVRAGVDDVANVTVELPGPTAEATATVRRVAADRAPPARCTVTDDLSRLSPDARVLARRWRERHPCDAFERCPHPDRVVHLVADLDPTPGNERVLASRQFGVLMLSRTGEVLAARDEPGCGRWPDDGQWLRLSARTFTGAARPELVVRQRTFGHCGELVVSSVLQRRGAAFEEILEVDEEGTRGCNVWQSRISARISVPQPGVVQVRYDGWMRRTTEATHWEYGPKQPVHHLCTMQLGADGRFDRTDDGRRQLDPPGDHRCD